MKKIVALVLSVVMVMGLATTAFAMPDKYDVYAADKDLAKNLVTGTFVQGYENVTFTSFAAKTNTDGSGNVAYLACSVGPYYFVKTTTPTVSDFAVTAADKTEVLFYVTAVNAADVAFAATAKAFNDFGTKCGQLYQVDKTAKYYEITAAPAASGMKAGQVFAEVDATVALAYTNVLVGSEIVTVATTKVAANKTLTVDTIVAHNWAVTGVSYNVALSKNVPTEATCLNCGAVVTEFYKDTKVPAGKTAVALDAPYAEWFFVEPAAAGGVVVAPAGDKVESAQTFDAGIAMYVGMSVMAAAGSAVVLKKKD